jgi:hypothetical protein
MQQDVRRPLSNISAMIDRKIISRWKVLFWLFFSLAISIAWGYSLERSKQVGLGDFRAVYYGARTAVDYHDPYLPEQYLAVYRQEGAALPGPDQPNFWRAIPFCVNLPTTLFLILPFTILGWGPAHLLWMLLMPAGLLTAAWLVLDLASDYETRFSATRLTGSRFSGTRFSLILLCVALANCEVLFQLGNVSGIAVSLCVFAVWCFLRDRYVPAGILCLAVALALKPQEIGLIWLYFLLAGGLSRRRALQTIGITAIIAIASLLWISTVSPHWLQEWHANVAATSVHGDLNDPGPTSIGNMKMGMTISLQSVISYFRDDPRFYNPATYLLCAPLILLWTAVTIRARFTRENALLALASMAALSMLPIYHRQYDVKLLILAIPACAMLSVQPGRLRRAALLVTTAGIVLTSDIPVAALLVLNKSLGLPQDATGGKLLSVLMDRSPTLVLLVTGIFYLWEYARRGWFPAAWYRDPSPADIKNQAECI